MKLACMSNIFGDGYGRYWGTNCTLVEMIDADDKKQIPDIQEIFHPFTPSRIQEK